MLHTTETYKPNYVVSNGLGVKRRTFVLYCLACVVASLALRAAAVLAEARQPAIVLHVIDGDTVRLRLAGKRTVVRLIGIDAPEIERNERSKVQAKRARKGLSWVLSHGSQARNELADLLHQGSLVFLEMGTESHDKYGRTLAYLYRQDGTFVNRELLERGLAWTLIIPPNDRFELMFRSSQRSARAKELGLWSALPTLNHTSFSYDKTQPRIYNKHHQRSR